ncbi:MAG: hypothetical protein KJ922_06115, partial [Nanoarchaeota archaeon]|nr:hypothetical protein [Nanoarchaeota archaeon]
HLTREYNTFCNQQFRHQKKSKIISGIFLLLLPHLVPSITLATIFPDKWFGIILVGVFLSDLSLGLRTMIKRIIPLRLTDINKINHTILASAIIILLIHQEFAVFLSGLVHLMLDWLGF